MGKDGGGGGISGRDKTLTLSIRERQLEVLRAYEGRQGCLAGVWRGGGKLGASGGQPCRSQALVPWEVAETY